MTPDFYHQLLAQARRRSRIAQDAEDLVQEALLAAARAGRTDLENADNRKWLVGVVKNLSAMTARTEGRRKAREKSAAFDSTPDRASDAGSLRILKTLPGSARILALLILHGMSKEEILHALDLKDATFRQRLTAVRRAVGAGSPEMKREALALAYSRREAPELDLGPLRRALLQGVRIEGGVGTHDPDGHLIIISKSTSRKRDPRQR